MIMKRKILIFTLILLALFSVASVCAGDVNDTLTASEDVSQIELTATEDNLEKNIDENQVIEEKFVEDNGTFTALQQKIDGAEVNSTIVFPNNYYHENDYSANGISISKSLTIDGNGFTIDANNHARIFNITGATVTLQNINFVNGNAAFAGAVYCKDSNNLTILNCSFSNNHVSGNDKSFGGAVLFEGGILTIDNSKFINNDASVDGGAVYFKGNNGIINASNFTGNKAYYNGAVYMNSVNGTVDKCIFANNVATNSSGALGWVKKENGSITYSQFINNTAPLGGAIYVNEGFNFSVYESKFVKNNATTGGAIYWTGGDGMIVNSTFDLNSAFEDGGAVYFRGNGGIIDHSNFTNNKAKYNGALYMNSVAGIMDKCIFANNVATDSAGAVGWVKKENGTIRGTKFINNSAPDGGAIYLNNGSEFYIITSDFINNTASSNGGAIYWDNGADGSVTASSFINNKATKNGGAIYFDGSNGKIAYSQFANNTAASGGAIYNNGTITVGGSKFADNNATDGKNDIAGSGSVTNIVNFDIGEADNVYGKTAKIIVNLTSNGKPVNGGNVSTVVNNVTYNASVVNGVATLQIPNLNVGIYELWLSYVSNDSSYRNEKDYYELSINKQNIEITANDAAYIINYGGKYSVTLKDSDGNAVVGEKVTFTLNGKVVGSASTNAAGVAAISLSANALKSAKTGKKNMVITLTSDKYNATAKTVKITINKEKTKIAAKNKKFKRSQKTKKYTITLKNSKGKAVKKVKVTLKVKGKTYTAKTNAKGKATFKIKKLTKKGKHTATIKFKGNAYYNQSTKKVKITVR